MKRFLLALALVGIVPVCFGAPSTSYTSYFHNTHTYTNATVAGTNSASRGVFTNGLSAGASTFTDTVLLPTATTSMPSIGFTVETNTGIGATGSSAVGLYTQGVRRFVVTSTETRLKSDQAFGFSSGLASAALDVALLRDAADTLALRRGTNFQRFNAYGTYTDSSNYRRGYITDSTAGVFTIGSEGLGSGATGNSIEFHTDGSKRLEITSAGVVAAAASLTAVGTISSSTGNIQAPSGNSILWSTRSRMQSASNGTILMVNAAQTDFDRLQFGGTTTNFNGFTFVTNAPGMPYTKFTDATGANLRKVVNAGENGGRTNVLTDATATSVLWIAVANTNAVSGDLSYEIFATDGTDTQVIKGRTQFGAAAKTTTVTCNVTDVQITPLCTAGTLTATVAANVVTNNILAITINADTSLTTTNLLAKWRIETPSLYDVNPL